MTRWAVDYRSSAVSTSASLKKAIRDEHYEDLKLILEKVTNEKERTNIDCKRPAKEKYHHRRHDDHPLWETNSRGWTPMHVAAIASPAIPLEWWRWILQQQDDDISQSVYPLELFESRSKLWTRQTEQGSTVVELFFRTALDPLPWCKRSVKEEANRLKDAIERILKEYEELNNSHLSNNRRTLQTQFRRLDQVDEEGKLHQLRELIIATDDRNEKYGSIADHNGDVALVFQFWNKLAALFSPPQNQHDLQYSIVHILARLRWCPELVGRLGLALFPLKEGEIDATPICTEAPLHSCVRSFGGGTSRGDMQRGMLQILCDADPCAASIPDPTSNGRLPLHVALSRGSQHSWEESLCHLFAAHPSSVRVQDPVTGLPAFCLACDSLSPIYDHQIEQTAKDIGNRYLCWYFLCREEKTKARKEAVMFLECRKLTTIYEVLRKDPSVLNGRPSRRH